MATPKVRRLADYKKPEFTTDLVNLNFDIHEDHTNVTSKVTYKRTDDGTGKAELVLNAQNPNPAGSPDYISQIIVDGFELAQGAGYIYDKENDEIRIPVDPSVDALDVEIRTWLEPQKNSALTGLYQSDGSVITQCESESFRRIVPSLDRPDVLACYVTRIEAPEAMLPVLNANGDQVGAGTIYGGRHWAGFYDPLPKNTYVFCTANGDLVECRDTFKTMSGRNVDLVTYLERGNDPELARHAVNSLKDAMKWDEDIFSFEYQLKAFKTVAVAKFSFGAMENKGLNVFRDSLIKADPRIATNADYKNVTRVVGHEFFHDKTGDEVTIKNFFQIAVKEGWTVFREQEFMAAMTSPDYQRIDTVRTLRGRQFAQDDSPLAIPVLPKEVMSIENCYNGTTYEKACEVIRMIGQLIGRDKLIEGMKQVVAKYSGQAIDIDDFLHSFEEVSGRDLMGQFHLWYDQSGRPRVKAEGHYDPVAQTYTLTMEQHTPPTPDQPVKKPMLIPVRMGLVDAHGNNMPLVLDTDTAATQDSGAGERVLEFTEEKQTFVFKNVTQEPAFHSLLRQFSAPITLDPGLSADQLRRQLLTDTDSFNRWEAGQKLAMAEMKRLYEAQQTTGVLPRVDTQYISTLRELVNDTKTDPALLAQMLTLPGVKELEAAVPTANPASVAAVSRHLKKFIGDALYEGFVNMFERTHTLEPYSYSYAGMGRQDLKAIAVGYLTINGGNNNLEAAATLYKYADNMTDKMMAINGLNNHPGPARDGVLDDFYRTFSDDQLVIRKWMTVQSQLNNDAAIDNLRQLTGLDDPQAPQKIGVFDWTNPGHVQAVFQLGFTTNYNQFHRPDGKGYELIADAAIRENGINPLVAGRIAGALSNWRNYAPETGKLMVAQLERINAAPNLHKDVKEPVLKSLPSMQERLALGLVPVVGNDNNLLPGSKPALG